MTENEEQLNKLLAEMQRETQSVRGDEFGLFDYNDLDRETQETKWRIIAYIMDMGKIQREDVAVILKNNPWFNDWYCRTVLSDNPIAETYH
jgi:hypothetical protein